MVRSVDQIPWRHILRATLFRLQLISAAIRITYISEMCSSDAQTAHKSLHVQGDVQAGCVSHPSSQGWKCQ